MTTQAITESGMTFGPYTEGHCFHIEKSKTYVDIQNGVKMAEFLLLRTEKGKPHTVWVVEAKSSTPRPETQPNFNDFISEIHEKLVNAFSFGLACCLKRHRQSSVNIPESFESLDLSMAGFRFVLVINGHKDKWLHPIQKALKKSLHATIKTWALSPIPVIVINDTLAMKHGLILPENGN